MIGAQAIAGIGVVVASSVLAKSLIKDWNERAVKRQIKTGFEQVFEEGKLSNIPKIEKIEFGECGFIVRINTMNGCMPEEIFRLKERIENKFKLHLADIVKEDGDFKIMGIMQEKFYKDNLDRNINEKRLLIGYNVEGKIMIDLDIDPHTLVVEDSKIASKKLIENIIKKFTSKDIIVLTENKNFLKVNNEEKAEIVVNEKDFENYLQKIINEEKGRLLILDIDDGINKYEKYICKILNQNKINLLMISKLKELSQSNTKNRFNTKICSKLDKEDEYERILGTRVWGKLERECFYMNNGKVSKGVIL